MVAKIAELRVKAMTEERDDSPRQARLFIDAALTEGGIVELDADRAHYLRNVLRLETGDAVSLFNGRDGEWRATHRDRRQAARARWRSARSCASRKPSPICGCASRRSSGRASISSPRRRPSSASRALVPVFTRYTAMTRVNVERLRANAIEAAEQTERLSVPEVHEPVTLEKLLAGLAQDRRLLMCRRERRRPADRDRAARICRERDAGAVGDTDRAGGRLPSRRA